MKKKLSFLLVAFMAIATFAWADDLNESSGNQGSSSTAIAGTSYTLDGKFVAGQGSVQQGNMPDKGVKLRSNQGNLVFEVNAGYKITKFEFWGCGNTTTTVDIVSATVDDGTTNLLSGTVTLPAKGDNTSGDIVLSDIAAEKNITLTFAQGSTAQIVGTWKVTYEQTAVIQKEITGVTLNGTPISENDLAQLKANKTVTIDGSSLNGAGAVVVTLSSGATTVAKTFENSTAVYTFKVDNDEYKIYVRGVAKTYTEEGTVVAFSANGTNATGANTKTITMNGISFSMVADKTFQYGSGNVTLGENVYVPLKLSTGSAVNVTFPEGKKATKVKIYGWSANGDGKLYAMKESADGEKSVDVSNDVYYATNTGADIYPSVYEYNLDNWESLWFNAGGSPSQPFVVMEFTFAEEQPEARTYAIVGDFTGGWPAEIDDDGSKDVEMTADPTAEGIYTLTIKDFDAEAKKYEYKLRANKSWNVYNLPADGNQDFVFGTNDYPAGKYDLTFTADVNKHVLTLDVVKAEESVEETEYTVQFVNGADWKQVYAYTWTGDGVSSEKVEQLGVWAGTEMGLIDTEAEIDGKKYPVYELKFKAAVEPANIIFSDGTGGEAGKTQTADQEFVDGYRYALVIDDEPVNPDQQEEEIEFTAAGTGTNPMVYTKDHFTYTFDKGSGSTNPAYVTSAEETRLYAKGTLTIKAKASEKIIAISYDATLNANKNGVTPTIDGVAGKTNAGTWDAENWSWTGEDTEVTMTTSGTAGNVGFKGITVTYTDEGGGGDQPVEIKTLAINGEFPGMSWNPEEGIAMQPEATAAGLWTLELKNVTVEGKQYDYKAFADGKTDGYQLPAQGNNNWVFGTDEYPAGTYDLLFTANTSTNELTLAPTYVGPNTIAQLNALANKKEFTFTGNAIVVAKMEGESSQTIDNYIYIKDETGSSLIYDKGGAHSNESDKTKGLLVGDVITAPWNGTVSIYKNLFEVRPAGDEQLTASENVGEVTYPEATADDVKAENVNQVVEIKGLTIDNVDGKNIKFTIGDDLVNGWNQFGIELPEVTEGKTFDVVGAISIYGENVQFQPFTITEVEPQLNPYTATFTTNLGWKPVYAYAYNYTPADEAEGVQEHIYVPVEWPGTPMTLNAETGVYEVAIESAEEPNLIIFNDGTKEGSQVGINQTPNWEFENGKAYDYSTQPFKVTFNTDKWENVWAYTWTGETPTVEWPGVAMKGDKGVYTYEFEAIEAPEMIIFNNGTEAEVKEQTGDLPFVNGTTYTFSEEKATAWAGDPDVAIEETGIIIPAETLVKADVQAEKIIRIVAKEIAVAAPARGLDNTVTEGETIPFTVTKKDGTLLVEDKDITVTDDPGSGGKAYEFTVSPDASTEVTTNGFIIKPKDEKNIAVTAIEVEKAKAPAAEDINITPEAGADIAEALATAKAAVAKVGNITINLTADANYTVSAPIEVPAALTINGNGATIDASGQTGNFIEMAVVENPTEWTEANVTVKELTVKGLKKALFYSACKNYFGDVTVDKCVVEQAADATTFDYTKGSTAVNFTVTNSTFYAPTATTKSFYSSQGGQKTTEYNGEAVQTFTFTNNTMYNLASGKNFFTHRQNNQKWLKFVAKNNIFVNCGKSGQTIKGMNGGGVSANPQFDIDGNVFNYGGADTGAAEETGDADEPVQNTIAGVVTFTDAAAGNFDAVLGTENVPAEPTTIVGDPRWIITNKQVGVNVVIAPTEGDISTALAEALAPITDAGKKIGDITINLTADANYTVSAPIEVPAALTINGNGAKIDASALAGNFIQMAATYDQTDQTATPTEWTVADIAVKNVTIKGLKKALFYSTQKMYVANDFTIDNCVVEQAADAITFDYTKGSTAVNFTVTNSTFYAPTATTKSFYSSQGGQKTTEYNGEAVQTFTFTNNTMYNLASGKNFFTHRQNNQKWLKFVAKNNIFVNCGKSGQTIKGMNGGGVSANPQFDIDGNVFNYGGADTGAAEETGDADEPVQNTIAGVVTFTDATAGNFNGVITVENVVATVPGDPRWTITAVKQLYIIGGPKEWKLDDMTEMTFNAETQAFEFEYAPTATAYFAFADKQFTAEEAAADGAWDVFNANNRYALDEGDKDATLNEAVALQKVNGTIVLNPGTYKISVAKDFSTVTITGEAAAKYYLVGSMTDWEIDANYELTPDNENAGQYKITVDLAADAQFKIVNSDKTVWYPDGMGNNYGENGELQGAGKYTVYFRPNADGGDDWFYHVIFAQKFYNITVVNCDGMTITPEVTEATAGTKVWAAVAMTDGYEPEFPGFTNTDTGDVIEMTEGTDVGMDEETGKVWIIMPAQNLTITAKAAKVSLITLDLSQENGSATCISVNKEDPASFYKKEGKEIYLNVTPDAGYTADITVTAGEDPVEVIAEAGTYHEQAYTHKFIMPAKAVTVKVVFTKADAINGIDAEDADDNTPIYNLSGQKVTKSYKGVVIKNGKKYMQK